jgi:hypothetical protein
MFVVVVVSSATPGRLWWISKVVQSTGFSIPDSLVGFVDREGVVTMVHTTKREEATVVSSLPAMGTNNVSLEYFELPRCSCDQFEITTGAWKVPQDGREEFDKTSDQFRRRWITLSSVALRCNKLVIVLLEKMRLAKRLVAWTRVSSLTVVG